MKLTLSGANEAYVVLGSSKANVKTMFELNA